MPTWCYRPCLYLVVLTYKPSNKQRLKDFSLMDQHGYKFDMQVGNVLDCVCICILSAVNLLLDRMKVILKPGVNRDGKLSGHLIWITYNSYFSATG